MKRKLSKKKELSLHLESEIVEEMTEENSLTLKKKKRNCKIHSVLYAETFRGCSL